MLERLSVWLLACLVLPIFAVRASSAHQYEETIGKTFPFKPGGKLILINTNGKITVWAWEKGKLRLRANLRIEAQAREEAKQIAKEAIGVDLKDRGVEIVTKRKTRINLWRSLFGKEEKQKVRRVDYELALPKRADLDMRTVNGGIEIADIQGRIEVRTTNGRIKISGIAGFVNGRTTNGSIWAELREVNHQEPAYLTTTNGSIQVYLSPTIKTDIIASTATGRIHTDLPLELQGNFSGRRIKGKINGGGPLLELHTINGGIEILGVNGIEDKL